MLLSVVVVNWNSKDDLEACLRSLAAQSHPELEVIVVDNGSRDGSAEMVARAFPAVTLLAQAENLGFAEACNLGIEASHAEWVCMLNNDTVADPGWAAALSAAAREAPAHCGMLQSLMVYRSRPDVVNSTGITLDDKAAGHDRLEGASRAEAMEAASIFCPTAGAAAYRRRMLDAISVDGGYFDRRHFMYYEDLDLGWRARLAGWSASYVPEALVEHVWHGSSHRHGKDWLLRMQETNRIRMLVKNASVPLLLRTAGRTFGGLKTLIRLDGLGAFPKLRDAVTAALGERARIDRLRKLDRREVESRWVRGADRGRASRAPSARR